MASAASSLGSCPTRLSRPSSSNIETAAPGLAEYVAASLEANGRRLVVVDDAQVDDDLVRDMTEVLTSFCARLYGRRAAAHRAAKALAAAQEESAVA